MPVNGLRAAGPNGFRTYSARQRWRARSFEKRQLAELRVRRAIALPPPGLPRPRLRYAAALRSLRFRPLRSARSANAWIY